MVILDQAPSQPSSFAQIQILVNTQIQEVQLDELRLGEEYPFYYKLLSLYPPLLSNYLKKKMSLKSLLTCNYSQNTNYESIKFIPFNQCSSIVYDNPKLSKKVNDYLINLCGNNSCLFKTHTISSKDASNKKCFFSKAINNLFYNDRKKNLTNNLNKNNNKIQSFFLEERILSRHFIPFNFFKSLNKTNDTEIEKNINFSIFEMIIGGVIPKAGRDGARYSISIDNISQSNMYLEGDINTLCLAPGEIKVVPMNTRYKVSFSRPSLSFSGQFDIYHEIKVSVK